MLPSVEARKFKLVLVNSAAPPPDAELVKSGTEMQAPRPTGELGWFRRRLHFGARGATLGVVEFRVASAFNTRSGQRSSHGADVKH